MHWPPGRGTPPLFVRLSSVTGSWARAGHTSSPRTYTRVTRLSVGNLECRGGRCPSSPHPLILPLARGTAHGHAPIPAPWLGGRASAGDWLVGLPLAGAAGTPPTLSPLPLASRSRCWPRPSQCQGGGLLSRGFEHCVAISPQGRSLRSCRRLRSMKPQLEQPPYDWLWRL